MKDFEFIFPAGVLFVVIRAFALSIYVPLGLVIWILTFPRLLDKGATIGSYLGWLDINVCYLLIRSLFRPLTKGKRPSLLPVSGIPHVKHRIGVLDPT